MFVSVFLVPFYYMYDRYYLRYQRYRVFLDQLQEKQKRAKNKKVAAGAEGTDDVMVSKEDMMTRRTYEEKYPRDTDESLKEGPISKE